MSLMVSHPIYYFILTSSVGYGKCTFLSKQPPYLSLPPEIKYTFFKFKSAIIHLILYLTLHFGLPVFCFVVFCCTAWLCLPNVIVLHLSLSLCLFLSLCFNFCGCACTLQSCPSLSFRSLLHQVCLWYL